MSFLGQLFPVFLSFVSHNFISFLIRNLFPKLELPLGRSFPLSPANPNPLPVLCQRTWGQLRGISAIRRIPQTPAKIRSWETTLDLIWLFGVRILFFATDKIWLPDCSLSLKQQALGQVTGQLQSVRKKEKNPSCLQPIPRQAEQKNNNSHNVFSLSLAIMMSVGSSSLLQPL